MDLYKRVLALILCLVMVITCFTGCGADRQASFDVTSENIGQLVSEVYLSEGEVIAISENKEIIAILPKYPSIHAFESE